MTDRERTPGSHTGGGSRPERSSDATRERSDAGGRDSGDGAIPIADPDISREAIDRVESILESGHLADGPAVRSFESAFGRFCGTDHAVATSNGTTALVTALEALGLEEGDAVVTTPFSFVASANAVRLAGGTPVFADVDPETLTLDPASVERVLSRREDVVGLLPVHLYGLPAAMTRLCEIADDNDLFVLEDACQAHGAAVDGDRVGSIGDAGCFSFYPTKNATTGEGGMITTDREDVAARAASYVNHGRPPDDGSYDHRDLGHNFRMTSVAAAIGRVQLRRLPSFNETRREHAAYYDEQFADLAVRTPPEPPGRRHVYHQYTLRTDDREGLRRTLDERGVDTAIYYDPPIHRQPAYETVSTAAAELPRAERAAEEVVSIPVHPGVSERDRRTIAQAVRTHEESG